MLIHESVHILCSLIVGAVAYKFYKSYWVFIASFATGLFLDVDHLFDYFHFRGFHFSLSEFATGSYFIPSGKILLPFHGFEWAILLGLISLIIYMAKTANRQKIITVLLTLAASLCLHLIYDTLYYGPDPGTYFIIYRFIHHFNIGDFQFHHGSMNG